jgi:hypothetical protein
MVQDYIKKEYSAFSKTQIQTQLLNKSFPVYKQLETMKEYDISYTIEMQSIIIKTINDMNSYLEKREMELNENKKQIEKGIFIDNLINTQKYHNAIMKSNVDMFSQYLQTFNHHHTNYLTELLNSSLSILRNVNNNIRTNNVECASANEVAANEVAANGVAANEVAANGVAANEVAANEVAANEVAANEVAANEVAANGVAANEVAANDNQYNGMIVKEKLYNNKDVDTFYMVKK